MTLLLPRPWLTKVKHQVIISVISLEGWGEENGRGAKCKLLLLDAVHRSRVSVSNTQQFTFYTTELPWRVPAFFSSPLTFWRHVQETCITCKESAQEGHCQDANWWNILIDWACDTPWKVISFLVVIMRPGAWYICNFAYGEPSHVMPNYHAFLQGTYATCIAIWKPTFCNIIHIFHRDMGNSVYNLRTP